MKRIPFALWLTFFLWVVVPAICCASSSSSGVGFTDIKWLSDGRHLSFTYLVNWDDEGRMRGPWSGMYDAERDEYWSIGQGFTTRADDLDRIYLVNSLGVFATSADRVLWHKVADRFFCLRTDRFAIDYSPQTRELVVGGQDGDYVDLIHVFSLPDEKLKYVLSQNSLAFVNDEKTRVAFGEFREGEGGSGLYLQIADIRTAEAEIHPLRLSDATETISLLRIPETSLLVIQTGYESRIRAYDFRKRQEIPVLDNRTLDVIAREAQSGAGWNSRLGTFFCSEDSEKVWHSRRKVKILKDRQSFLGGEEYGQWNLYRFGEGMVQQLLAPSHGREAEEEVLERYPALEQQPRIDSQVEKVHVSASFRSRYTGASVLLEGFKPGVFRDGACPIRLIPEGIEPEAKSPRMTDPFMREWETNYSDRPVNLYISDKNSDGIVALVGADQGIPEKGSEVQAYAFLDRYGASRFGREIALTPFSLSISEDRAVLRKADDNQYSRWIMEHAKLLRESHRLSETAIPVGETPDGKVFFLLGQRHLYCGANSDPDNDYPSLLWSYNSDSDEYSLAYPGVICRYAVSPDRRNAAFVTPCQYLTTKIIILDLLRGQIRTAVE